VVARTDLREEIDRLPDLLDSIWWGSNEAQFNLSDMQVHQGSANGGHYYSYIQVVTGPVRMCAMFVGVCYVCLRVCGVCRVCVCVMLVCVSCLCV
jgi:hypothetical protein